MPFLRGYIVVICMEAWDLHIKWAIQMKTVCKCKNQLVLNSAKRRRDPDPVRLWVQYLHFRNGADCMWCGAQDTRGTEPTWKLWERIVQLSEEDIPRSASFSLCFLLNWQNWTGVSERSGTRRPASLWKLCSVAGGKLTCLNCPEQATS